MPDFVWKEIFPDNAFNTAVAASGTETIQSLKANQIQYAPFNRLLVNNRDDVPIKVELDGLSTAGNVFELEPKDVIVIEPSDGITFSFLFVTNLDSATAETANKILFRWSKAVAVEPKILSKAELARQVT